MLRYPLLYFLEGDVFSAVEPREIEETTAVAVRRRTLVGIGGVDADGRRFVVESHTLPPTKHPFERLRRTMGATVRSEVGLSPTGEIPSLEGIKGLVRACLVEGCVYDRMGWDLEAMRRRVDSAENVSALVRVLRMGQTEMPSVG